MTTSLRASLLLVLVTVFAGLSGCRSSASAASTGSQADLSPAPPTMNQQFQARNPRVCAKMTARPNAAQAAVMAQCDYESNSNPGGSSPVFFLATDVVVELGKYGPPVGLSANMVDIQPGSNVIPLRGSSTAYTCTPVGYGNEGKNCSKSYGGTVGQGACWQTTFNEWRCTMTMGGTTNELLKPGPTNF